MRPARVSQSGPRILASSRTWRASPQFFQMAITRVKLRFTPIFLCFSADAGQPLWMDSASPITTVSCAPVPRAPGSTGDSSRKRPLGSHFPATTAAELHEGTAATIAATSTTIDLREELLSITVESLRDAKYSA